MERALLCSVVALCRHELAVAGYQFCILTLEEKIAKQKDLPEDVLPGGTALSAKGFSYYSFLISLSLMLLSILPKHHLYVNSLSSHCMSFSHRMGTHASSCRRDHFHSSLFAAEEKANTRLLLGMSLDSYARYLLNINQLPAAQQMYEKALQISNDVQGETHPQVTCTILGNEAALKAALLTSKPSKIHSTKSGSVFLPGRTSMQHTDI